MTLLEAVLLFIGVFFLAFDLEAEAAPPLPPAQGRGGCAHGDGVGAHREVAVQQGIEAEQLVRALTDEAVLAMLAEVRRQLGAEAP